MSKKKSETAFGAALWKVRRALVLEQSVLAASIGASRMSVSRWERGVVMPARRYHAAILRALAGASPELVRELTRALVGVDPAPPPLASAERAIAPIEARAAMSQVLLDAAEELDLSPKRLRAAFISALASIERQGLSTKTAREALTPLKKTR